MVIKMFPRIKTRLTVKKASLREHVEANTVREGGARPRVRVYTNEAGEKFTVTRKYSGRNRRGQNERGFDIIINKNGTGTFAKAEVEISPRKQISAIEGREIYIFDVAIPQYHSNPQAKKGRDIFSTVIDECVQLGQKEFGTKPYYITLIANNQKIAKHYSTFGFELLSRAPLKMRLKIN